jgi:hexosaminidase
MTAAVRSTYRLETSWSPAGSAQPLTYSLRLTNLSDQPLSGFRLCMTGPARIDHEAAFENGRLVKRVSNYVEVAPPDGFVLAPGASWTTTTLGVARALEHWSDGANTAYLALADGAIAPVITAPTTAVGENVPLKRGAERLPVRAANAAVTVSIVPWPQKVAVSGSRFVPDGLDLQATDADGEAAAARFAELAGALFPVEGIVRGAAEGGMPVALVTEPGHPTEGYRINFAAESARIAASTRTGLLYGLITLGQILRGARAYPESFRFPTGGEIVDAPAMGWRGSHLDVSRQFYSSAEVGQFLRILAWNKMNRFHWHLSDDEGWRVEIGAYPELTEIGAWRGHDLPLTPLLGSGAARTGGYYTKAAVREIVALADRLGIDVVPEIDVPGHCYAVLVALPWLADPDETGVYYFHNNFPNACLNPAHEPVYGFIETVFGELLELFPSKTFHVGADEVPEGAWSGSPLAKAMNEKIGGTGPAELQAAFLRRVQAFLTSKGRITGAWEEAAMGGGIDKANCYLVGWTAVEVNARLAAEGYDIAVAPGQAYYLDMANGASWSEPGASWAGWSGPEETYRFEPAAGWSEEQKRHLLGVQACIWSEHLTDRAIFDRLVFPRLSAIAETGWTRSEDKSWERFSGLVGLMPILYGHWAE